MGRGLLASRWVALHLVVAAVVAACGLLGWWQFDRARDQYAQSARAAANIDAAPLPLHNVLGPGGRLPDDAVGRPVTAEGTYDGAAQLLAPRRLVDGVPGYAVITPLVHDGAALVVVRGWIPPADDGRTPDGADIPEPPTGTVTVTGWLAHSEEPPPLDLVLPAGQLGSVHLPSLLNLLPYPLLDAVVTRTAELPAPAEPLVAVPPPLSRGGDWPVQNLTYAVEWWAFGVAAVAVWLSAVRRQAPGRATAATGATSGRARLR